MINHHSSFQKVIVLNERFDSIFTQCLFHLFLNPSMVDKHSIEVPSRKFIPTPVCRFQAKRPPLRKGYGQPKLDLICSSWHQGSIQQQKKDAPLLFIHTTYFNDELAKHNEFWSCYEYSSWYENRSWHESKLCMNIAHSMRFYDKCLGLWA